MKVLACAAVALALAAAIVQAAATHTNVAPADAAGINSLVTRAKAQADAARELNIAAKAHFANAAREGRDPNANPGAGAITKRQRAPRRAQVDATRLVEPRVLILAATQADVSAAHVAVVTTQLDGLSVDWELRVALGAGDAAVADLERDAEAWEVDAAGGSKVARFCAVILVSRELAYEAAENVWRSALPDDQWIVLNTFERHYNLRSISLNTYPVWAGVSVDWTGSGTKARFTERGEAWLSDDASLPSGTVYDLGNAWVTPGDVSSAADVVCMLSVVKDDGSDGGCAAALELMRGDLERWHFFFVPTPWFSSHIALTGAAIHWVLRGVITGERRLHLGIQVDDLFLHSPEWDPETQAHDGTVRLAAEDLGQLRVFQDIVGTALPTGSEFHFEWALNGNGILIEGGYEDDALAVAAAEQVDEFYWVSHSFAHPDMDDLDAESCAADARAARESASILWDGLPAQWSNASMVPPGITGLMNGPCLEALRSEGILYEMGDNSRPEFRPETYGGSPYGALWSDGTPNVDGRGSLVLPRHGTNIFWDNSSPDNNLAHFNYIQGLTGTGNEWTWAELMEFEAEMAAKNLLQWRHDPFMFHQSNALSHELGSGEASSVDPDSFPYGTTASSLSLWTHAAIDKLTEYSKLPIVSWRQDDMAARKLARDALDKSEHKTTIHVRQTDGVPVAATVWLPDNADTTAEVVLSGLGDGVAATAAADLDTVRHEVYAAGEETAYLTISPDSRGPVTLPIVRTQLSLECVPECDGDHGECVLNGPWPRCKCDNGWAGEDCSEEGILWSRNLLENPSFESTMKSPLDKVKIPSAWDPYFDGGITWDVDEVKDLDDVASIALGDIPDGDRVARASRCDESGTSGFVQFITLDQVSPAPIKIEGMSRVVVRDPAGDESASEDQEEEEEEKNKGWERDTCIPEGGVSGWEDGDYSVYIDAVSSTGRWITGTFAPFGVGVHGWEHVEITLHPTEPVAGFFVYAIFRSKTGTVDFDQFGAYTAMAEETDDAPISTTGRCGFNTRTGAICPTGSCCTSYGWCEAAGHPYCMTRSLDDLPGSSAASDSDASDSEASEADDDAATDDDEEENEEDEEEEEEEEVADDPDLLNCGGQCNFGTSGECINLMGVCHARVGSEASGIRCPGFMVLCDDLLVPTPVPDSYDDEVVTGGEGGKGKGRGSGKNKLRRLQDGEADGEADGEFDDGRFDAALNGEVVQLSISFLGTTPEALSLSMHMQDTIVAAVSDAVGGGAAIASIGPLVSDADDADSCRVSIASPVPGTTVVFLVTTKHEDPKALSLSLQADVANFLSSSLYSDVTVAGQEPSVTTGADVLPLLAAPADIGSDDGSDDTDHQGQEGGPGIVDPDADSSVSLTVLLLSCLGCAVLVGAIAFWVGKHSAPTPRASAASAATPKSTGRRTPGKHVSGDDVAVELVEANTPRSTGPA